MVGAEISGDGMSKGNPDISLDIYHALMSMLHAEKTTTQVVADIMRIPLEQVVDGCVYQFELEIDSDDTNSHVFSACMHEGNGKATKRISHYDLGNHTLAEMYSIISRRLYINNPLHAGEGIYSTIAKGTLRAIKTREVV